MCWQKKSSSTNHINPFFQFFQGQIKLQAPPAGAFYIKMNTIKHDVIIKIFNV